MEVPFNPIRDIPETFRKRVCVCDEPIVNPFSPHKHMVWCQRCDKPMRWQLRICSVCRELYIADFRRPDNCKYVRHQRCWDCLNTPDTSKCDGYLCVPEHFNIPPVGLNPTKMTTTEMDETLKELGIDF